MSSTLEPLIRVQNLVKDFPVKDSLFNRSKRSVHAVRDVSFEIYKGETLGLVGESGCGKSTLGRCILQLTNPTSGNVFYRDQNLTRLDTQSLRKLRKKIQIIFQDPYSSLNPRMTVQQIIAEPLEIHQLCKTKEEKTKRIYELLEMCGLRKEAIHKYPHEFSGGQRQRISIARALAVQPEFIVCDEPVSSLDVSIQAQIINLLQDLQRDLGLTYLFISHDLKVVEHISNRIAVMYLGKFVELASTPEIIQNPKHPYTKILLSSVLRVRQKNDAQSRKLSGVENPSAIDVPTGCAFHLRCPASQDKCKSIDPEWVEINRDPSNPHWVSCHYA
jgi:oligopeptide transport system ATP-binding protein